VDYDQFLSIVQQWAHVDADVADRAVRATLHTLADRLSPGVARSVAAQLPAELLEPLYTTRDAERFDVDEFLDRVAKREGVDLDTAEEHVRAVFRALRKVLPPEELRRLAADLPEDIRAFLEAFPVMSAEEFLRRVAERTGLDTDGAARATVAVLETLAERIAGGDVHDLISRLPAQLHGPLKRGEAESSRPARRMSIDEFLERVAEREAVSTDVARTHVRAVLATLRDAVDEEFFDVRAQLPPEYSGVLPQPEPMQARRRG
jgi:uncharacterized protein (DUF2267 family)